MKISCLILVVACSWLTFTSIVFAQTTTAPPPPPPPPSVNDSRCEETVYPKVEQNGFCVPTADCCEGGQGIYILGLCPQNGACCYSNNTCPEPTTTAAPESSQNQEQQPEDNKEEPDPEACSKIAWVKRSEWKALPPRAKIRQLAKGVNMVILHHSDDGQPCFDKQTCGRRVRSIQAYHQRQKKWYDIGYNWLVGGDGSVYEGRGWSQQGTHTLNYNNVSIGIALIGNFNTEYPEQEQQDATRLLLQCGVNEGYLAADYDLYGHSSARCTSCPGIQLQEIISKWPHFKGRPLDYRLDQYSCPNATTTTT